MPSLSNNTNTNIYNQYLLPGIKIENSSSIQSYLTGTGTVPLGFTYLQFSDDSTDNDYIPDYKINARKSSNNWLNIPVFYNNKDTSGNQKELIKVQQDVSNPSNDKIGINIDKGTTISNTLEVNGSFKSDSVTCDECTMNNLELYSLRIIPIVITNINSIENRKTCLYIFNITDDYNFTIPSSHQSNGEVLTIKNINTGSISVIGGTDIGIENDNNTTNAISLSRFGMLRLVFYDNNYYQI